MARVTITIKLGNEAMQSHQDVGDVLRETADQLERIGAFDSFKIVDLNGNTVGECKYLKR